MPCFWTNVVFADDDCTGDDPGGFTFDAFGDNNVTTVTLTGIIPPPSDNNVGPTAMSDDNVVYNGVFYADIGDFAWFTAYGDQANTYSGSITDCELQQLNPIDESVINTTPMSDITLSFLDFENGLMFQGFSGPCPGFPVIDGDSKWRFVGTISMTSSGTGDPITAVPIEAIVSAGPNEIRCIDFPGGEDPNPFPFYRIAQLDETEEEDEPWYVVFADTGGYACGPLGDTDFTVDGEPYTQVDFENFCS